MRIGVCLCVAVSQPSDDGLIDLDRTGLDRTYGLGWTGIYQLDGVFGRRLEHVVTVYIYMGTYKCFIT